VVQQREIVRVRYVGSGPAREARELDRQQCISKRALCWHIVRQVGGERNCCEQFGQTEAMLRRLFVDWHARHLVRSG